MELKEGELYTSSRLGLFVITNLYEQPNQLIRNVFGYSQIGTCERLNFGERVYKLHTDDITNNRFRIANDNDIKEFILNRMSVYDLGDQSNVFIDDEYLFINDIGNAVSLTKVAALKLKEILNKELI